MATDQPLLKTVHALRILLLAVMALLLGAFAIHRPELHEMLLGGAVGLLIVAVTLSFQIKNLQLSNTDQPSDVGTYRITS